MAKFISKTDRLIPKDWTYPESIVPAMPTLNYEMLNSMLAQQQGQFDLARTISEKQPQVLQTEGDLALYDQYKQMVDTGLQSVTNAYATQGAAEGSRAYRQYLDQMRGAWKPGGVADALNNRYTGYYTAKKAIEDQYKDDVRGVNKTLALRQLDNQLKSPINYQDGRYQQITAPDMVKDPEMRKAINDMIKQIDDSGDTQFLGNRDKSMWIEKIKTEGRPAERIKLAVQALSEQPEFAAQIQRDAQYQALNIDPTEYQSRFNSRLDKQLSQTEEQLKGKNAKELLEQQGYDTSDLSKAKKEYIQDQKNIAEQMKSKFNINEELAKDVYKDYENYALGFVSKRVDRDLIANQTIKWRMDNANSRAQTNALIGIRDALAPQAAPTGTVTSGIAQQLPEVNKHYDNLKKQQAELKGSVDKALNDPNSTFNGWKMEDVASVTNLWKSTMDKLPANTPKDVRDQAFAQALQASGTYQWKPEQINKVINEFDSVDGPAIVPALNQYQETQYEIERVDNARTNVGLQYIDTPEGKESFNLIKGRRLPGESDEQLVQRALSNPEQFNVKGQRNAFPEPGTVRSSVDYNPAVIFKNQMERGVKENKSNANYNWGDMATTEVSFNADDKIMGPFIKTVGQAIEGGSQYRYMSEGKQGLTFRQNNGSEVSIGADDKVNITTGKIARDESGTPIMKFDATVTKGNKTYQTTVNMDIVPGSPEQEQVITGLKNTYVGILNSGNVKSANGVLDNILKIQNPNKMVDAGTQAQVNNLKRNQTKPLVNILKQDGVDEKGKAKYLPASAFGYSGIDTHNDFQTRDPETGAILNYKTYAFIDQTGNKSLADVYIAPNGTEVMVSVAKNMSTIRQERLGKEIQATTPVVRESVKLPQGQLINLGLNQSTDE